MNLEKMKKRISKKAKKGFQGYPVLTIAYYGPNNKHATKVAVGVLESEDGEPEMKRFILEHDVRNDSEVQAAIIEILEKSGAKSVSLVPKIIGCPHEEGLDYPEGKECPQCKYWHGRDRFTGGYIQ